MSLANRVDQFLLLEDAIHQVGEHILTERLKQTPDPDVSTESNTLNIRQLGTWNQVNRRKTRNSYSLSFTPHPWSIQTQLLPLPTKSSSVPAVVAVVDHCCFAAPALHCLKFESRVPWMNHVSITLQNYSLYSQLREKLFWLELESILT